MHFSGVTIANDKAVMVQFNPGWGEPGEWYLSFSDKTQLTIDNCKGMGDQEKFLDGFSADQYRDTLIAKNWVTVGETDDVIRIVLEYVGYNDDNRKEDQDKIVFQLEKLREVVRNINSSIENQNADVKSIAVGIHNLDRIFNDIKEYIENCQDRIRVYDALNAGETVGSSWSNETFIRDFPNSKYAPRILEAMKG